MGSREDTHILLVEENDSDAKVLSYLLEERGFRTTTIADPRGVAHHLHMHGTDLVLTEVMLPYIDGFSLCAAVRRDHFDIPVIFLTARTQVEDTLEGFACGADDYIGKPFEPNILLARIQAVLHRARRATRTAPKNIISVGETHLDIERAQFFASVGPPTSLTPTETKILECLMRNTYAVISRERLIELTSSLNGEGTSNRIDVYIRRLRKKIEAAPDEPDFIHTVRGLGYIFRDRRNESRPVDAATSAD